MSKTLERMGETISHLSEDYTKISSKYLQLIEKIEKLEKKLDIAKDFMQYVLDKWELDTVEIQDKAEQALKEMEGVK